jgi:hypothetical protein
MNHFKWQIVVSYRIEFRICLQTLEFIMVSIYDFGNFLERGVYCI